MSFFRLLGRVGERRDADRWLRASEGRWESHPAFAWRVAELTSAREQRLLARSLRGVVRDVLSGRPVLSASPLNRRALVPYADAIEQLAERLADPARPVTGAGIVLVRDLLTDGGGPLYTGGSVDELAQLLARITSTLDATRTSYLEGKSVAGASDSAPRAGDASSMRRANHV